MRDFFEIVVVPLFVGALVLVVVFVPIILLADFGSRYSCGKYEQVTGKKTRYATLDSCYVSTDAGWQRWDEYKARAVASEGLAR